jgi:hypothetical protein
MKNFKDLIYYKQDIIDEYSDRRKALTKKEIEDLLRCALLFIEKQVKTNSFESFEIPNIGFLHKKLDISKLEKPNKKVQEQDSMFVRCAYLDTTFLPIEMRKDMLGTYYYGVDKKELQKTQNDK